MRIRMFGPSSIIRTIATIPVPEETGISAFHFGELSNWIMQVIGSVRIVEELAQLCRETVLEH